MRIRRQCLALVLPVLLAGCLFGGKDERTPRASGPIRERPGGPVTLNGPVPRETQQCFADLSREEVRYSALPDRDFGSGCIVTGAVQLLDIGVPVTNLKSMRCPLARSFAAWVRNGVGPAARQILGSDLVKVESFGTYSCRGIIGGSAAAAARVSEHGLGNAVDVSAFVLRDGRRVTVLDGWNSPDEDVREFLQVIHRSACKRFRTVLSPNYNAAHRNHLHLDMGRGPLCAGGRALVSSPPWPKAAPMTDTRVPSRVFRPAQQDAETAKSAGATPQTEHPAYRLAFQDMDFLLREDLRPVRFQLELLKPQLLLDSAHIASTFVFYGSARIPEPSKAEALRALARDDASRRVTERLIAKAKYYDVARELARLTSHFPVDESGKRHFVVCSGGGPSIMEAANRGAADVGAESVGLNIVLPHEQAPNPYVTPGLSMQFHYFALRKMHFLLHARAVAVFPGGFGTFDEAFELLTLIQTGKIEPMPVLFYGREFWSRVVDFEALCDEGVISPRDLKLFRFVETAEEGWAIVQQYWRDKEQAEARGTEAGGPG